MCRQFIYRVNSSAFDLMIVVVYAPQEAKESVLLWDYLAHCVEQWVGNLIMMGDFMRYDLGVLFDSIVTGWELMVLTRCGSLFIGDSRDKWAIEEDENVKFFHGMLNKKRNQSNIRGIMVNGTWVDDPVQVKREFFEHFRGRISKEEVKRAVWDCGIDKSSGPDGFSFSFYCHFWPVIEKDVFEAVDHFFITPFTYLGTKVGGNMSRKKALERNGGQGLLFVFLDEDETLFNRRQTLFLSPCRFFNGQDPKGVTMPSWVKVEKWVWRFYSRNVPSGLIVIRLFMGGRNLNKDVLVEARTLDIDNGDGEKTRFWCRLNWYEAVSSKENCSQKARSGIEEMQLNYLAEISRMTTLVPCEDCYVWTLESDGFFSVASIRKEIDGNRFQDVSLPTRWVKSVPIKVNIIAWKVKSNALPTRFNISRRGMDIDSIVCPICNAGVESTNHIFFQCVVVRQIMRKISSWWNIDYSDVNSYEEWRVWLVSIRIQSKLKGILEGVYYGAQVKEGQLSAYHLLSGQSM
ncbi:RNA-directed DNA polymerase, eukaryota [Tanacetum coccineum]